MLLLKKSRFIIAILTFIFVLPLMAQDSPPKKDDKKMAPKVPEPTITVSNNIASNLVFRGGDIFTIYADQTKQSYGSATGAWSYEPYFTYNTPIKGLSFTVWANYTLQGRQDVDTDGRFQTGPGEANIFAADLKTLLAGGSPDLLSTYNTAVSTAGTSNSFLATGIGTSTGTSDISPQQHKEANGMKRADEVDITIKYSSTGKVGTTFFGLQYYTFPSKLNAFRDFTATEVFFGYGLPGAFSDISATAWINLNAATSSTRSNTYIALNYAPSFKLTKTVSLSLMGNIGYGSQSDLSGIQDITGSVGLSAGGFNVSLNAAYRPTLAFFDGDSNNRYAWSWLNGASDGYDGYVTDPAQVGLEADITKALIETAVSNMGNSSYVYTARQKLPRVLYWVSLGYTITL